MTSKLTSPAINNAAASICQGQSSDRPTGLLKPEHPSAQRALLAATEGRAGDAERSLAAYESKSMVDDAWALYIRSELAMATGQLADAKSLAMQSTVMAMIAGTPDDPQSANNPVRLAGKSLCLLGQFFRRQELTLHAIGAHLQAHNIYEDHGSSEELWESATALGLDHDVARQYDQAQKWHRLAAESCDSIQHNAWMRFAKSQTNLAASYLASNQFDEAVEHLRVAHAQWCDHDMGSAETALTRLHLGEGLLRWGQALFDQQDATSETVLKDALSTLHDAGEQIEAFGAKLAPDLMTCREQIDLAQRLAATCSNEQATS